MARPIGVTILIRRVKNAGLLDLIEQRAQASRVPMEELLGLSLSRRVCSVRRAIWEELRGLDYSLDEIGRLFGRHHTTVLEGLRAKRKRSASPLSPGRLVACSRPRVYVCSAAPARCR